MPNELLEKIMPRHHQILDLAVMGWDRQEIARECGLAPSTVSRVLAQPRIQHMLAVRKKKLQEQTDCMAEIVDRDCLETARRMLDEASELASGILVEQLLCGDSKERAKAANDILDRVGIARVTKNENRNKTSVLMVDAETAERIMKTRELDVDEKECA
jgi:hypothetical protein